MSVSISDKEYWISELKRQYRAKLDALKQNTSGYKALQAVVTSRVTERFGITADLKQLTVLRAKHKALADEVSELETQRRQLAAKVYQVVSGISTTSHYSVEDDLTRKISALIEQEVALNLLDTEDGEKILELQKKLEKVEWNVRLATSSKALAEFVRACVEDLNG